MESLFAIITVSQHDGPPCAHLLDTPNVLRLLSKCTLLEVLTKGSTQIAFATETTMFVQQHINICGNDLPTSEEISAEFP